MPITKTPRPMQLLSQPIVLYVLTPLMKTLIMPIT